MKIAFHTLGCKVNQYETEAMMAEFKGLGHDIVSEHESADVYVINTCTVTAMADKKSRQFARRMKKQNPDSVIVVTGCYSQISPEDVAAVDGVDIVTGTADRKKIPEYVADFMESGTKQVHVKGFAELDSYEEMSAVTEGAGRTRAFIKIQEGCNRFCSYCVIPYARGKIRSRDIGSIKAEAEELVAKGYKEIVLAGINTALYDMEGRGTAGGSEGNAAGADKNWVAGEIYGVEKAIAVINEIPGDFRIRLSSLEPAVVSADYVRGLMKYDKLCHHMHLSCQSGSDQVLSAMNRPYTRAQYTDIVKVLRDFDPLYGISTDIIVGFPGEKDGDFQDSLSLVEECGFVKTHIFKYSKRPFTKAAELKGQVSPQVKGERSARLQEAAKLAMTGFLRDNEGTEAVVLIEEYDADRKLMHGYSDNYINIYVNCENEETFCAFQNTFVNVTLEKAFDDGMKGALNEK
ncbi:MAG: MiaB/RimO family radical SAM methylthiotransferase [Firmicutes bacterium]|nr:MiaB/RimO family radical SAM methylthiotransferase [Bacillota bacterium]